MSGTQPTKPTPTTTSPSRSGSSRRPSSNIDASLDTTPGALAQSIKRDYATRFHMFLIVATCIAVALLVTKGLLSAGVKEMWIRYAIALLVAYGTFFTGVWVWLHLSKYGRHLRADWGRNNRNEFHGDAPLDIIPNIDLAASANASPDLMVGHGGTFDGGGAGGSWDAPISPPSLNIPVDSSGSGFSNPLSDLDIGVGDIPVDDEGGCALVIAGILLAAVLFVIFGAASYVIYQAPAILAEVVFEVLMGSTLARGARALDTANWGWALWKKTALPFGGIFIAAMSLTFIVHVFFPQFNTAGQVLQTIFK